MKGQISIDLIFTLIAAILISTSLLYIANNQIENQQEILLGNKLKLVCSKAATFVTSSQAMEDTNFIAKTKLPKVIFKGNEVNYSLEFDAVEKLTSIRATVNGKDYFFESSFSNPFGIKTTIVFDKRLLVVSN